MANFDEFYAELNGDPITGYLHTGERINIPLISHIVDNLYVGGHDHTVDLGGFFTHVFSLYYFPNSTRTPPPYTIADGVEFQGYTMYDSPGAQEDADLDQFVSDAVLALEAGGNVLIHCQAGINRSNLVASLVLRQWKDMTSKEAIALLRERRSPLVLANRSFERYLLDLDGDGTPDVLL